MTLLALSPASLKISLSASSSAAITPRVASARGAALSDSDLTSSARTEAGSGSDGGCGVAPITRAFDVMPESPNIPGIAGHARPLSLTAARLTAIGRAVPELVRVNGRDIAPIATVSRLTKIQPADQERARSSSGTAPTAGMHTRSVVRSITFGRSSKVRKGHSHAAHQPGVVATGAPAPITKRNGRQGQQPAEVHPNACFMRRPANKPTLMPPAPRHIIVGPAARPALLRANVDEAPRRIPAPMVMKETRAAELSEQAQQIRTLLIRTFSADGLITDEELVILQAQTRHVAALDEKADDELLAIALMRRGRHSDRVQRLVDQLFPDDDECA